MDHLHSENSRTQVCVRFVNLTCKNVDIIWVDFTGNFVKYQTIARHQFVDINTFTGHPWIFWDKNKDNMCVQGKEVFYPTPSVCPTTNKLARKCLGIHLPLYTLKMRTLLAVRDFLRSDVNLLSDLDLPNVLIEDLKNVIEVQNNKKLYEQ